MSETSRIRILYFSDILCVWAYLAQIRLDELMKNYSTSIDISYHFMPVFGSTHHRIGEGWKNKGSYPGFSSHTHEVCEAYPHIELHKDVWKINIPKTSATSHLFIKAVQVLINKSIVDNISNPDFEHRTLFEELIWQIRLAFFRDAKDVSDMKILYGIANSLALPVIEIQKVLEDGSALSELFRDVELKDEFGIEGSPTYILNEGRQKLYGNVGYRIIEANLQEILKQPNIEASWC